MRASGLQKMVNTYALLVGLCLLARPVSSSNNSTAKWRSPDFELYVLAWRRPHSLERLLNSLKNADYPSDQVVSLEVHIDAAESLEPLVQETAAVSNAFTWPHGSFKVVLSSTQKGVFGSWLDITASRIHSRFLILEDDVVVSPFYYQFLWNAWMRYQDQPELAGISLQRHWGDLASNAELVDAAMQDPFLSSVPGPWGFSPSPRVWKEFQTWCEDHPRLEERMPGVKLSDWYESALRQGTSSSMWTYHFALFCNERNYQILYAPASFCGPTGERQGLIANHRESGEHFDGSSGPDVDVYQGHRWAQIKDLAPTPKKVPWPVERQALFEGGRILYAMGPDSKEKTPSKLDEQQKRMVVEQPILPPRGFPEKLTWGQHFFIGFCIMAVLLAIFECLKQRGFNSKFICLLELCMWAACAITAEYALPSKKRRLAEGDPNVFWAVCFVAFVCSMLRRRVDDRATPMNRNMTNEWKGMMQLVFEMYHYTDYWQVYAPVRSSVSAYVWLTGWGNSMFFKTKKDHSAKRVLGMLWRIGGFCPLLATGTATPWISYYIVLLHTAHFLFVWLFSLCGGFSEWPFKGAVVIKLLLIAGLFQCLTFDAIADEIQSLLASVFGNYFASYLRYRMEMDRFSSIFGIIIGHYWEELLDVFERGRPAVRAMFTILAVLCFGIWLAVATRFDYGQAAERQRYTEFHPYVGTLWIPLFLLCRNATPLLRKTSLKPFEMLGERSLELYLLQFHLFLAVQASHVLVITGYSTLDVFLCWLIMLMGAGRCFSATKDALDIYSRSIALPLSTTLLFASCIVVSVISPDVSWAVSCCMGVIGAVTSLMILQNGSRCPNLLAGHRWASPAPKLEVAAAPSPSIAPPPPEPELAPVGIAPQAETEEMGEVEPDMTVPIERLESDHVWYPATVEVLELKLEELQAGERAKDEKNEQGRDEEEACYFVSFSKKEEKEKAEKEEVSGPEEATHQTPIEKATPRDQLLRWIETGSHVHPCLGSLGMLALVIATALLWSGKVDVAPDMAPTTFATSQASTTRPDSFAFAFNPQTTTQPMAHPPPPLQPLPESSHTMHDHSGDGTVNYDDDGDDNDLDNQTTANSTLSATTSSAFAPGTVWTVTTAECVAGTTMIGVADVRHLALGMVLTLSSGARSETRTIVTLSLVQPSPRGSRRLQAGFVNVDIPLDLSYPAAAKIVASPSTHTSTHTSTTTTTSTLKYCKADDLEWVPSSSATAQLVRKPTKDCIWRRFSRSEARDLLAGRHLMFTGDSVPTYQYLAMALYLTEDLDIEATRGWLLYEALDFNFYYRNTTDAFGSNEMCDCGREACHPFCSPQTFVQNRFFRIGNGGFLSMVPTLGDKIAPRGHTTSLKDWTTNCASIPCFNPIDWEESEPSGCYVGILKRLVERFEPDILVQGLDSHWTSVAYDWFDPLPDRSRIFCGMDSYTEFAANVTKELAGSKSKPLVLTRTNNEPRSTLEQLHNAASQVTPAEEHEGVLLYDVGYLSRLLVTPPINGNPSGVMIDLLHFDTWVYQELNMLLLNMIAQHTEYQR